MSKSIGYDIDLIKRKRNKKIKNMIAFVFYLMVIVLIVLLLLSRQENRELKHQVRDLTVMITAERIDVQEPARDGYEREQSIEDKK